VLGTLASSLILAACVEQAGSNGAWPASSVETGDDFGGSTIYPGTDEGDEKASYTAEGVSDTLSRSYSFIILDCGSGVEVVASEDTSDGLPRKTANKLLSEFVTAYRASQGFSDLTVFYDDLKRAKYSAFMRTVYTDDKDEVTLCRHFYPKVKRDWPVKTAQEIAERRVFEKKLEAILTAPLEGLVN
jgi:hypothetical protein